MCRLMYNNLQSDETNPYCETSFENDSGASALARQRSSIAKEIW